MLLTVIATVLTVGPPLKVSIGQTPATLPTALMVDRGPGEAELVLATSALRCGHAKARQLYLSKDGFAARIQLRKLVQRNGKARWQAYRAWFEGRWTQGETLLPQVTIRSLDPADAAESRLVMDLLLPGRTNKLRVVGELTARGCGAVEQPPLAAGRHKGELTLGSEHWPVAGAWIRTVGDRHRVRLSTARMDCDRAHPARLNLEFTLDDQGVASIYADGSAMANFASLARKKLDGLKVTRDGDTIRFSGSTSLSGLPLKLEGSAQPINCD